MANKSGKPRAIHPATRANLYNYALDGLIEARKVASNTWFARLKNGVSIYKFHNTEIIRIVPTGHIYLNNGGWPTATTKNRMNEFANTQIYQRNWDWYVVWKGKTFQYMGSRIILDPNGTVWAGDAGAERYQLLAVA